MGIILGLIKSIIKWILYLTIFAAVIVLIPNLPPFCDFTSLELEVTQSNFRNFDQCTTLNNAKNIYKSKVHGPEAFELVNGELFTTLATGEVVKLGSDGAIKMVTKIGEPCLSDWEEEKCGRPLGIQYSDKEKKLYVCDSYYGIWKVDINTDKKVLLVSPRVKIGGKQPMLINDLTLAGNGDFYWTDSSTDFKLYDGFYTTLVDRSGRLLYYNAAKNESTILWDKLFFPNGVVKSPDGEFIVISESFHLRLLKYYISGPKKGKKEIFISGLPGVPDNIRPLPDGSGMLVALYSVFDDQHPFLLKSLSQTPIVRKFIARLIRLIELPFEYIDQHFPNDMFKKIVHQIGHFKTVAPLLPPLTGFLKLDWNGKFVDCYINSDKSLTTISDMIVYNDLLYTGSPHNHYIGALPIPKSLVGAFKKISSDIPKKSSDSNEIKKEQQAPQQQKVENKEIPKASPQLVKQKQTQQKPIDTKTTDTPKPVEAKPQVKVVKPTENKPDPVQQTNQNKPTESKSQDRKTIETKPLSKDTKPIDNKSVPENTVPGHKSNTQQKGEDVKHDRIHKTVEHPPVIKSTESKPTVSTSKPIPKSVETKPSVSSDTKQAKSQEIPKPKEQKPIVNIPKAAEIKTAPSTPKPTETKLPKEEAKPVQSQPKKAETESRKANVNDNKEQSKEKVVPEQIPIKEDIPSDTVKPNKETLKVIKKTGPVEIPNPNL